MDTNGDGGGSDEERNAIGAIAECALAKALGIPVFRHWCEYQAFSLEHHTITSDVGVNLQVRAVNDDRKTLWLRPEDMPKYANAPFILGRVLPDVVVFVGFIWGHQAAIDSYWDRLGWGKRFGPHRAAWNVPTEALAPLSSIPLDCIGFGVEDYSWYTQN